MIATVLQRLHPNIPAAWAAWPLLEARVREWTPKLAPRTPVDRVIAHLRALWGSNPHMLGAWLARRRDESLNGHDPQPVVGHMVAWVDAHWGEPVLFCYQLATDPGQGSPERLGMLMQLEGWRQELNALYESQQSPLRITHAKLCTQHGAAYQRWLGEHVEVVSGGEIMFFDMRTMTVPSEAVDG